MPYISDKEYQRLCQHEDWYMKDGPGGDICKCETCGKEWSWHEAYEESEKKRQAEIKKKQANCRHDHYHIARGSYENQSDWSTLQCDDCGHYWHERLPFV